MNDDEFDRRMRAHWREQIERHQRLRGHALDMLHSVTRDHRDVEVLTHAILSYEAALSGAIHHLGGMAADW